MGLRLRLFNLALRMIAKSYLHRATDPVKIRRSFARLTRHTLHPLPYTVILPDQLGRGDLPALWVSPPRPKLEGAMLYLHGGGYIAGSPHTHKTLASWLAHKCGMRICLPAYRLAPEHQFPDALEDAITAYHALLDRGYRAEQIILAGDSAGGGLMLALLGEICRQDLPRPAGALAFSPWVDLSLSSGSLIKNQNADPVLPSQKIAQLVAAYLGSTDAKNPQASPLYGQFDQGPPVLIQVGSSEILRDDGLRMAKVLQDQGVDAQCQVWPDTPHVWHMFHDHLSEARKALDQAADFVKSVSVPACEPKKNP